MKNKFKMIIINFKRTKRRLIDYIQNINVKEISDYIEKILCAVFSFSLFMILIREIDTVVKFVKKGVLLLGNHRVFFGVKFLVDEIFIPLFYLAMAVSLILLITNSFLIFLICLIKDKKKIEMDENERYIYNFLEKNTGKTCLVIDGAWGAGKTYTINKFMKKYMKYKLFPLYTVSCFGLSDRDQIIDTIKNECKHQDTSLFRKLVDTIRHVPMIGEVLCAILEPRYDFSSLDKKTIFVFEDFERISCESDEESKTKYNLFAGFINDLYEKYKFRIIIICNADALGTDVFYDLLYDKLKCDVITISNMISEAYTVAMKIMDKIDITDNEKENISFIIENEIGNLINIFNSLQITNVRVIERIFEDILITVNKYRMDIRWPDYKYKTRCIIYSCLYKGIRSQDKIVKHLIGGKTYFENYLDIYSNKNKGINPIEARSLLMVPLDIIWYDNEDSFTNENSNDAKIFSEIVDGSSIEDNIKIKTLLLAISYIIKNNEGNGQLEYWLKILKDALVRKDIETISMEFIYKIYLYLKTEEFYRIYLILEDYIKDIQKKESDDYIEVNERRVAIDLIETMESYERHNVYI